MKQPRKTRLAQLTFAALFGLMISAPSSSGALDNKGTDFILAFNPNESSSSTKQVQLSSDVATNVTVEYPVNSPTFNTTVAVNPGTITTVTLPNTASVWANNTVANNCVRAFGPDEFVCYMTNVQDRTSDAALALPVDTMNTEYLVSDYNPRFVGAQFTVVAAFDNTTVTITPTNALVGRPAGVPFNVTLNRGEGYHARSQTTSGAGGTLTGTVISSDRPVGLTNGNGCTQVPTGVIACDHIFEVAQPVQSWGNTVLVNNLPNRPLGSIYRILASQDNTTVSQDGGVIANLNRGQFFETATLAGSHVFSADKPIFVTQFMVGQGGSLISTGDPAMGNMIPFEQYQSDYTFATVGANQFAQHFVTIIAQTAEATAGQVLLDGVPIPAGDFSPIAGSTFSTTIQDLTQGSHTTSSPTGHGITVEGFNTFDSYIYPGGGQFQFINPVGDAFLPVLSLDPVQAGPPPSVCGSATDNTPSEDLNNNQILDPGEDTNNNGVIDRDTGIFFVELAPGATNLTLTVDPFVPGDPSVSYCVDLVDPGQNGSGIVVVTDGAGNTGESPVNLSVTPVNLPPVVGCECFGTALAQVCTLFGQDDTDPAPQIFIKDSVSGFESGPFTSGDMVYIRTIPFIAPFDIKPAGALAAYIVIQGSPLIYGVDSDGSASNPIPCGTP